jgi:hypothetical protein
MFFSVFYIWKFKIVYTFTKKAIANGSLSSFNKDLENQLESYTSVDMTESSKTQPVDF